MFDSTSIAVTIFIVAYALIISEKVHRTIVGIFGANMGPNGDFEMGTMVGYIYKLIENNQIAYAAAGSLILFAIILVVTIINNVVSKKTVHY